MRPLIYTPAIQDQIDKVVAYGFAHPYTLSDLFQIKGHPSRAAGYDPQRRVNIPVGYGVVFSVEQQPPPMNWCRHLSVSVSKRGKYPSVAAVNLIMKLFGFRHQLTEEGPEEHPREIFAFVEEGSAVEAISVVESTLNKDPTP